MEFTAKTADILTFKTQCAVVFALNESLLASAELVDAVHQGILSKLIKKGDLEAYPGKCAWVQVPASSKEQPYERVLLVHLGKGEHHTGAIKKEAWVAAIKGCSKALEARPVKDAALFLDDLTINTEAENSSQTLAELAAINITRSHYRYTRTKTKAKNLPTLKKLTIACASSEQRNAAKLGIKTGQGIGIGINAARELGNLPSNICTPTYLAELAKGFEEECKPLRVKVLNEKQMEKLGMGSLLSVTRGAEEEAKLIIMEYKNNPKASRPHVLVGKGITFDTGGISLKAGSGMDEMKFDMCGAASVFGTLAALMEMEAEVHVIGIVAAAENMPSGSATKPGDIVTSMSGQTIEVLNTDAEGRLVLCDALTYAERFKPKTVVDIATLTGACVVALGKQATGLYSNNDQLAANLIAAGEATNDRAWRMPLWDAYQKQLDSNFADMANIGGPEAGSVTAACFLSRFTKKYPWAHLDIAGTGWLSGAQKGATGRPVELLVYYLLNNV